MKKIVLTAALSACAAIVTAQTVTSANIVGYAKKSAADGAFLIVSPQFQGAAAGTTLGNAFGTVTDQTTVYAWNGAGYDTYTYFGGYGWFDLAFSPAEGVVIPAGAAVWLKGGTGGINPIMSGEVPSAGSITNTLTAGFNLIANPYPTAMALDDIDLAVISDQDVVYYWNGAGYDTYTYFAGYGWFDLAFTPSGGVQIPVGDGVWLKSTGGGSAVFNKNF